MTASSWRWAAGPVVQLKEFIIIKVDPEVLPMMPQGLPAFQGCQAGTVEVVSAAVRAPAVVLEAAVQAWVASLAT